MNDITKNKERFLSLCSNVHRDGFDEFLADLERTDFFVCPASAKYHGAYPGGLLEHSLNVYDEMISLRLQIRTRRRHSSKPDQSEDKSKVYEYLAKRCISPATIDGADVRQDAHGNIAFNYYDTNDVLCLVKYRPSRKVDKSKGELKAWCQKDADTMPLLFNMNKVNVDAPLLVCEGEIDCLAAIESGWSNTVSVPFGANNYHWIQENFDWLEQFESIRSRRSSSHS